MEFWSLFDFFMFGFLGIECEFKKIYGIVVVRLVVVKKGGGLSE